MYLRVLISIMFTLTFCSAQKQEPVIPQYVKMLHTDIISAFDFGIYKLQNDIRYIFRNGKNQKVDVNYDAITGKIIISIWDYQDQQITLQQLKNYSKENISIIYDFVLNRNTITKSNELLFSNFYFKYFCPVVETKIENSSTNLLISDLIKNMNISYNIRYKTTENKINIFTANSDFFTQQVYFTE